MLQYFTLLALLAITSAFPNGAPNNICRTTRTPVHGADPQAQGTCPWVTAGLPYTPGEWTTLGIYPGNGSPNTLRFKGFLISVWDLDANEPVGRMRDSPSNRVISDPRDREIRTVCDSTSMTHSNNTDKKEIYFDWFAPATLTGAERLEIRLTIVQNRETFWVDCGRTEIEMALGTTSSTSTTTTTAAPRTPAPRPTTNPTARAQTTTVYIPPSTQAPTTTRRPTTTVYIPPSTTRRTTTYRPPTTTRRPTTTVYIPPSTTRRTTTYRPPTTTRRPTTTVYIPPSTTRRTTTYRPPTTTRRLTTTVYIPPSTTRRTTTYRPPTTTRRQTTTVYIPPRTTRRTTTYRPPTTTRRPTTTVYVPPRTRAQTTTRRPTTTVYVPPSTTRQPVTTQRAGNTYPAPSNTIQDSYLDYQGSVPLKHKTMNPTECMEYGNFFSTADGTDCREYIQSVKSGHPGYRRKCPAGLRFDPRACTCAFTFYCSQP